SASPGAGLPVDRSPCRWEPWTPCGPSTNALGKGDLLANGWRKPAGTYTRPATGQLTPAVRHYLPGWALFPLRHFENGRRVALGAAGPATPTDRRARPARAYQAPVRIRGTGEGGWLTRRGSVPEKKKGHVCFQRFLDEAPLIQEAS